MVEPRLRMLRGGVLAALTLLIGWITLAQARTSVSAPPNLRSIHPAPPNDIRFRGKTITLTGLENPLRKDADSLAKHYEEGKRLYYQNCLPCHGDHLDGAGTTRPASTRFRPTSRTTAPSPSLPRPSSSGGSRRAGPGCPARERRGTRPCRAGRIS